RPGDASGGAAELCGTEAGLATLQQLLPAALELYRATSASWRSSSSGRTPQSLLERTPKLIVAETGPRVVSTGQFATALRISSALAKANDAPQLLRTIRNFS